MEDKTNKKDQLQAVWFAAGVAVVIACLERAAVLSIFKQWHMWVFLALNLLLIAILFTSTYSPSDQSNPPQKSDSGQENDETSKTRPPETTATVATVSVELSHREDVVENGGNGFKMDGNEEREEIGFEDDEYDDGAGDKSSPAMLSNEELNEKVEAFISRFRQEYLVSDVKISRTRSDNVCESRVFSKTITV